MGFYKKKKKLAAIKVFNIIYKSMEFYNLKKVVCDKNV